MKNRKQLALLLAAVLTAYTCRMIPKFAVGEWALQLSEPLSLLRSVIYLTLFMGWGCSLKKRIRQRWARRYMVGAAGLMVFWLFVRTFKFFFAAEPVEYRYLWYLYYVPMLFLPCTALSVALTIGERDDRAAPRQSRWLWALSGALLAQYQKTADINLGTGMVIIGLASLIIGETLTRKGSIGKKAFGAVLGSILYRFIIAIALRLDLPSECLKLISAVIVALAIGLPALRAEKKGGV